MATTLCRQQPRQMPTLHSDLCTSWSYFVCCCLLLCEQFVHIFWSEHCGVFVSSSLCVHNALDFQICEGNSISCFNLVFLYPAFCHFISDLWSDQSSQDFRYVLEIDNFRYLYSDLILRFDFCLVLDWQQWVWTWSPFCCFFQKQALNLASICPLHHFFIIQTLPGVVLS